MKRQQQVGMDVIQGLSGDEPFVSLLLHLLDAFCTRIYCKTTVSSGRCVSVTVLSACTLQRLTSEEIMKEPPHFRADPKLTTTRSLAKTAGSEQEEL